MLFRSRTALFNWLLARQTGGKFILRIDDTDTERNKTEALAPILEGFRWLGILWDEGPEVDGPHAPYYQSQRNQLYVDAAKKLLADGQAYPCYLTPDELKAERDSAEKSKKPYIHRGKHRSTPASECLELYAKKSAPLRLKVPEGQIVKIQDFIRGEVEWQSDLLGDPIILRSEEHTSELQSH